MLTFVPHKINEVYNKVEFYRVNKELCDDEIYKDLSPTAIVLYSLLCHRLSISYANELENTTENKKHYYDDNGNIYVIFTRMDLEKKLHVKKSAVRSAFKELYEANLIQEERQGRNKPNKIYVGKTIAEINKKFINWKSENQTSGDTNFKPQESRKSDANKNNILNLNNKNKKFLNYEQRDYSDIDLSSLYANSNFIEN
jgi:DNA-binding transcriptional ArsR family regulator